VAPRPYPAGVGSTIAQAREVTKSYVSGEGRRRRVLDRVVFEVEAGELVAILGKSGSGKTTFLHMLGGLDRPDSGTIVVAGRRLDTARERVLTAIRRQHVGFVFQSFHLLPELTGRENVLLPARLAGDGTRARARAERLLRSLGVAEAASRLPGSMSGGEQQRVAIARALVNDPALVLADEPTGNLDLESGRSIVALLRDVASGDRAVVLATHDVEAAARADRVLELRDGRLQERR
jgi:ABC-type lipoprotein export system ATPase subunit